MLEVDLNSKVVVQNRSNGNDRYRWMRSDIHKFRSMISGRFYRSKRAMKIGDHKFVKVHYLGIKDSGVEKNPHMGCKNILKVDMVDRKIKDLIEPRSYNPIRQAVMQSDLGIEVTSNPYYHPTVCDIAAENRQSEDYVEPCLKRNGVQVLKKRFCQRVPVGAEDLLKKNSTGVVQY